MFTRSPTRSSPRFVRKSVSGPTWNLHFSCCQATTVKQAPLIAMLLPMRASSRKSPTGMCRSRLRPAPSSLTSATVARHSMIPVNMRVEYRRRGRRTVWEKGSRGEWENKAALPFSPAPFLPFSPSSRSNAAVQMFRREVRRLVVHPEDAPFAADLAEVLGIEDQLFGADRGIRRILVEQATGVEETEESQGTKDDRATHSRLPSNSPDVTDSREVSAFRRGEVEKIFPDRQAASG